MNWKVEDQRGFAGSEAVEQLKEAVGRLIARRILREWSENRSAPNEKATASTDTKRTN